MSLEIANELPENDSYTESAQQSPVGDTPSFASHQWQSLTKKIRGRTRKMPPLDVLDEACNKGAIYRWGLAVAIGGQLDPLCDALSRFAVDQPPSKKRLARVDIGQSAKKFAEIIHGAMERPLDAVQASLWAAALPGLIDHLPQQQWWDLLSALQHYRESVTQRHPAHSPSFLIAGGELGLTLSWRLADLPSCSRLQKSSLECVTQWCKQSDEACDAAIRQGINARLVLASLLRCKRLVEATTNRKFKKQNAKIAEQLATWVVAMTSAEGTCLGSLASRADVADDLGKNGLLQNAVCCEPKSLRPALDATMGKHPKSGRLAWELLLPAAFQHSEEAKLAIMVPQWDVRRGRVHVDYSQHEMSIEVFGGKSIVLQGNCQTEIEIDGDSQRPRGNWVLTCDYTDDDVHYLEIEQPWTGGIVLQRQIMVVRDDRCVMLADSVLPSELEGKPNADCLIAYSNRIPLTPTVRLEGDDQTRDAFFTDGQRRGLVLPLSASEWKIGPSDALFKMTDDQHVLLTTTGRGRLYAPLWFDFQRRRFDRKRTWRHLTVADDLRIVSRDEAVGYRIQCGSEQWMIYRSLSHQVTRTVLGKHLVVDFFAARFHASNGSFEELVTVDPDESIDE